MKQCVCWVVAAACLLVLATGQTRADVIQHILDDGTAEFTTGFNIPGSSVVFANHFSTAPGGEVITSISISYGLPGTNFALPGTPVQLILFRDQNNATTPNQPVLLASALTAVANPNTNTFNQVLIPPTFVEGNLFVGALISNLPANGPFPVSFDRTTPQSESFGAWFTSAIGLAQLSTMTFDPNFTTDQTLGVNSNAFLRAIDGNYMIRAEGQAIPEPSSMALLALGALGTAAFVRRRYRITREAR